MRRFILLTCVLLCTISTSWAQLTGTKTIPGDYATVADAVTALNTQGVGSGGVIFFVAAGHTETAPTGGIVLTATGTLADQILFIKSGVGANPLITAPLLSAATTYDGVIKIAGGDYITFNSIDIIENPGNTSFYTDWGYALVKASATAPFNGCQYVTITDCNISLNKANTTAIGIYSGNHIATANTSLTITATTDATNNCKFYGNNISNVYGGISIAGYAASSPYALYDQNNEIGVDGANTITNLGAAGTSVRAIYGIYQNGLKVANNVVNSSVNGATTTVYGIFTNTGTSSNIDIWNNTITLSLTSGTYTSTIYGINNAIGSTAAGNTVNIYNNTITSCDLSAVTTGSFTGIYNNGTAANVNIYNNTVSGTTLAGTGAFIGIQNGGAISTNPLNIYGNTVSGNTKTGASGNMYCMQATTATITFYQNSIHDNAAAGSSTFYGYYNVGSPVSETYRDNTIYNLTHNGTGTLNAFQISTASGPKAVYGNTIYNLISGGNVNAYSSSFGSPLNFYKNNIYNLTTSGANSTVAGLSFSGPTGNIYNNFISDLKAPADSNRNAVIGINLTGGTTQNVYYNTIYLAATSSSTTNFGTSGIYASTTPTVELRNNIVVNASTPLGLGISAAYRRSSTTLTTYAATSNNNCFYAGTPSASNVILYDGTATYQTILDFQTLVAPMDGQSFSNLPPFVNIAAAPYDLHVQTTIGTMCESGGSTVAGITDDIDGHVRFGETGYTGTGSAPDVGADEFEGMPSFTCVAPTPGNTLASSNPVCNGETVLLGLQNPPSGTGISFQWQHSADGGVFTNITDATNATYLFTPDTSGWYQCVVTCQNGPTSATSTPVHLTFNSMITSVTPASRCGVGTVNLSATGTAANIVWYAAPTGGTALYTGPTFTTPILNDTTTYYVAAEIPAAGAILGNGASTGTSQSPFYHLYGGYKSQWLILASELTAAGLTAGNITTFGINVVAPGTAYNNFVLSMGTTTATAMTTTFETGLTPVFSSNPAVLTAGLNTIPITPFVWNGTSNLIIQTCWSNNNTGGTSASVKYDATPFVAQAYFQADNLTASKVCDTLLAGSTTSTRPQMFLNYVPMCSSPREPVTATVRPAPAVTASATPAAVCEGSSTQISATSVNDPNYTYNWMPIAQTGATQTVSPTTTTTYEVTANDASGGVNDGCVNTASVTVTVNPLPSTLSITPAADTLCPQAIQLLTTNGGLIGGTGIIGTGTSSSTTYTPFRGYYGGQKLQILFLASELSAIGMTNSIPISKISFNFATFTGPYTFNGFTVGMKNTTSTTTSTTLETGLTEVIPASSFVLSGTAPFTQTLNLATPFNWDGTSNLLIETCFNNNDGGGVSGNSAAAYYTTTGTYLTAYFSGDNSATVCSAPGTATRTYSRPNVGFEFSAKNITWSPTTGLYTDAAATVPYTGTVADQVYAKPASNAVYTATATSPLSCTTNATTSLTIDDLAISGVTATNITCNGLTDGSITVSHTGGYPGFAFSVDGGTTWQKSNVFNGLPTGSYTVMVKDTLNCPASYASNPVVITEPVAITISSAVPTIVSSCQLADGTITVTAAGGTGTLQYSADGTNWFASNVLSNLAAGNYNVQVKDANNCTVSYAGNPVSIGTPPAVIIDNVASTNSSCFGSDNGTITITASAGTLPYTFSIDGGTTYVDNSGAFTGLADGSYNIYVKDANTCITIYASNPVVITEPAALALTMNMTGTSCNGGSDGSAWVSVTGGTAPYSYLWNPGLNTNDTIFNVPAGMYHVGIMDSHGCTAIDSIAVTQPAAVSITNLIASNTLCDNSTDGAITIIATGGTGTLNYSIDNGTTWQTNNAFYSLAAGSYTVMVKDANECTHTYASNPVVIANPSPVVVTNVVATDVNCYGVNDGTITITATGGTGSLMYSINGGGTWQPDGDYTGLFAASRSIMVKDANGCVAAWANNPVVITMPTQISVSANLTNVLCLGGNDGTITVSATGGTPDYQYSIDNGTNYQVSANFAGLAAGSYNIKVKDDNGCVKAYASNPVTITEPASAVTISNAVGTNLLCNNGNDGSILVTATGGTGTFEYSADNGATWVSTNTITGLAAGSHYIRVRDANGCTTSYSGNPVVLTEPGPIFITGLTPSNVLCNGGSDGSIEIYSVGGTGTLQYSINGGTTWQSSYSFTGIPAGSYTVQVRDANGCIMPYASNPVVITEPAAINLTNVNVVENLCYGDNNASITITANGGFGTLEYTINNGISWTSGNAFNGLVAGTYNVKVRDENGCAVNFTGNPIVLTDPAEIVLVSVDATAVTSYGGNDGTIQVVAYGGTGALQYSNDNGTTWQYSNFFIDLIPGGYYILVKDANGCIISNSANPVIVSDFDGVGENEANSSIAVYPNPTENEITIQGSVTDQILSIEIISVEGKIIDILSTEDFIANNMKTNYVFAAEVKGVYFVRVITDQHVYLKKITVN